MFRITVVVFFTLLISIAAGFTVPHRAGSSSNAITTQRADAAGGVSMSATMNRRDAAFAAAATMTMGLIAWPEQSQAKPASTLFFEDSMVQEPSQMSTDGKTDLNAAFVGDYKMFPGMFPHAAGKIASNGPYTSVKDIYKIPNLTKNDVAMFKKYESSFTANPPGRVFNERINGRVST